MNSKFELNEMELAQVAGGHPRIQLHGPRRNSLKRITEVYQTVRKLVKHLYQKYEDSKSTPPNHIKDGDPVSLPKV